MVGAMSLFRSFRVVSSREQIGGAIMFVFRLIVFVFRTLTGDIAVSIMDFMVLMFCLVLVWF